MQLIVEPETTLDIEKTMSAVGNIQNTVENLDTGDFTNKCNGNKQILVNNDGKKEFFSEIEAALANMHADVEENDAELSNVDLSEVISKQNSHEDAQTKESQNSSLQNGVNDDETENMDKCKEIPEEDYLEDDIISISEEHFKAVPEPKTDSADTITDKDEISASESILIDEEDKDETTQVESQLVTENNDIIEVLEETENTISSEKESQIQEEKEEDVKNSESSRSIMQKEDDEVELIEEREKDSEPKKDVSNITDITMESESSCGKNIKLLSEDLEQSDVATTEQVEDIPSESNNEMVVPEEKDEVEIIEEGEAQNFSRSENKLEPVVEENDDVEFIEEPQKTSIVVEDKTDTLKDPEITSNGIKSVENEDTHVDDASMSPKSQPTVDVSNIEAVDSPVMFKDDAMDVDESKATLKSNDSATEINNDMDIEEVTDEIASNTKVITEPKEIVIDTNATNTAPVYNNIDKPIICKLSNTLDILSDDDEDEELPKIEVETSPKKPEEKANQSINIEDDDDIMLIDEDTNKTESNVLVDNKVTIETPAESEKEKVVESSETNIEETNDDLFDNIEKEESTPPPVVETKDTTTTTEIDIKEKTPEPKTDIVETPLPLIPENFVKTAKKKLSDMTRDELEEFCILKIVESIVDRGSLTEIKNKLLSMTQALDEHRKKALMLTKQNRDLQVVLKSVQEEQKKATGNTPITPLKITRSVGMQVYMEKTNPRKKGQQQTMNNKNLQNKNMMQAQGLRAQKMNQNIPVPRLVPAHNPGLKNPNTVPHINQMTTPTKINPANGIIKNPSPGMKSEKRPFNKVSSSITVDLTDDEPPAKMPGGPKTSPAPPVRLVPPQNLMGPRFGTGVNSPRKVYIPISGPQNQALRPGQTIMLKTVPAPGLRPKGPPAQVTKVVQNQKEDNNISLRHPAILPAAMKQYQPPNWKSLPPAPDLKLSKVENGIVISWKIEDVPEDSYEEIASYQLYAYQETAAPAHTNLWKKIGDVKALPLPMACTLTQFMAGYKYYFAVRAVDIRSRIGPFSLPGSILLLSKSI